MSRIDELKKQHPIYALSAIDIYKMMSPNQSNKYIEMLIKLDKSMPRYRDEHRSEIIASMVRWGLDYNYLETFDLETLSFVFCSMSNLMSTSRISALNKFASFIDRKLIENTDVTSYSTWEEIDQAVALVEMKLIDKALEKQIKKVYEDDTWLSLRPLSLEASMKYGANTKWCTTTESGQYYARYSARGILIYNINKKTGYKVACFKNLDSNYDNEFSWWDVTDKKIEALDSEAPSAVLEAIRNEIKNTSVANKLLMTKAEADKLEIYKDGNYRPGKYSEGPGIDNSHRTGGIIEHVQRSGTTINWNPSTGTNTTYTYNPGTNTLVANTTGTVGIGTINPTTQLQVNGDMAIDGDIVFRSGGEERLRLTPNGFQTTGTTSTQQYNHFEQPTEEQRDAFNEYTRRINGSNQAINEQVERRLFPELTDDDRAREAQQRLNDRIAEETQNRIRQRIEETEARLEAERVARDADLGPQWDNETIKRMQIMAGIDPDAPEVEPASPNYEVDGVAEPKVVNLSLWNKIKNTGRKLGKRFTSRLRRRTGVQTKSVSARLEAVKQPLESLLNKR
jgi:hypothetical protein